MSSPRVRPSRPSVAPRLATLLAIGGLVACGGKDPYAPVAQYSTVGTTFVLYPLSRAKAPYYSALELRTPNPVQPLVVAVPQGTGGAYLAPNFDVAFDLDAAGHIVLLPPKQITSTQIVPRTGFQTSKTLFDSLGSAPGGTYEADSAFRVTTGQTVVVQAQGTACSVASPFYAKLVVDSVNVTTGAITIRARVDPNCGFRSFAAGVPSS